MRKPFVSFDVDSHSIEHQIQIVQFSQQKLYVESSIGSQDITTTTTTTVFIIIIIIVINAFCATTVCLCFISLLAVCMVFKLCFVAPLKPFRWFLLFLCTMKVYTIAIEHQQQQRQKKNAKPVSAPFHRNRMAFIFGISFQFAHNKIEAFLRFIFFLPFRLEWMIGVQSTAINICICPEETCMISAGIFYLSL